MRRYDLVMSKKSHPRATDLDPAGRAFEKLTAAIQQKMDPSAKVEHDVVLKDRLGQDRQFDVVVRGNFGGQPMLGVIECKDYGKKVGTPEVDAFVTKAGDLNANFKILVARNGFSAPALKKCAFYGIKALSLIEGDPANKKFFLGSYWDADVTNWDRIDMILHPAGNIPVPESSSSRTCRSAGSACWTGSRTTSSIMRARFRVRGGSAIWWWSSTSRRSVDRTFPT